MAKTIKLELDEKAYYALFGVITDYIYLAQVITDAADADPDKVTVEQETIDDLKSNIYIAGQLMNQLMGEPESNQLN